MYQAVLAPLMRLACGLALLLALCPGLEAAASTAIILQFNPPDGTVVATGAEIAIRGIAYDTSPTRFYPAKLQVYLDDVPLVEETDTGDIRTTWTATTGSYTLRMVATDADGLTTTVSNTIQVKAGVTPQVQIRGNGSTINSGATELSTANGTDFGSAALDKQVNHTFTVANTGTASLIIGTVTSDEASPKEFTFDGLSSTYIAPGASRTLTVSYRPLTLGSRTTLVTIPSNAAASPFTFTVGGTGTTPSGPEILVTHNGETLSKTDSALIEGTRQGALSDPITLTITNLGAQPLTVGATLGNLVGCTAEISSAPAATVTPGGSTTVSVRVTPSNAASWYLDLALTSNDADEKTINVKLLGQPYPSATAGIQVSGAGQTIAAGDTTPSTADGTAFGQVAIGASLTRSFQVTNNGGADLVISSVTVDPASGPFTLPTAIPASIAVGGTWTFDVVFAPTAAGPSAATLTIASNATTPSFAFAIRGESGSVSSDMRTITVNLLPNGSGITAHIDGGAGVAVPATFSDLTTSQDHTLRFAAPSGNG